MCSTSADGMEEESAEPEAGPSPPSPQDSTAVAMEEETRTGSTPRLSTSSPVSGARPTANVGSATTTSAKMSPSDQHTSTAQVMEEDEDSGETRQQASSLGQEVTMRVASSTAPTPLSASSTQLSSTPLTAAVPCSSNASIPKSPPCPTTTTRSLKDPFDLRLQLWNLQDLGGGPSRGPRRSDAAIDAIARIIHRADADITAILEVKRKGTGKSSLPRYPALNRQKDGPWIDGELAVFSWATYSHIVNDWHAALESAITEHKRATQQSGSVTASTEQRTTQSPWTSEMVDQVGKLIWREGPLMKEYPEIPKSMGSARTIRPLVRGVFNTALAEFAKLLDGRIKTYLALFAKGAPFQAARQLQVEDMVGTCFGEFDAVQKSFPARQQDGAVLRWARFWLDCPDLAETPQPLFDGIAGSDASLKAHLGEIYGAIGENDYDDPEEDPPASTETASSTATSSATSSSMVVEDTATASPTTASTLESADKTAVPEDHRGFHEIERIVQTLNRLTASKEPVYGSMPTLDEVRTACDQDGEARYYTRGESYAFIYRKDRTRRLAPPTSSPSSSSASSPTSQAKPGVDFEFLGGGFEGRAPARATFVFGDAEIDIIAHHPPAENANAERRLLRGREFSTLGRVLKTLRDGRRLTFYLGDTNANTSSRAKAKGTETGTATQPATNSRMSDPIPLCDGGPTIGQFLSSLSDDPLYSITSIFRRAPTSFRTSDVREHSIVTGSPSSVQAKQKADSKEPREVGVLQQVIGSRAERLQKLRSSADASAKKELDRMGGISAEAIAARVGSAVSAFRFQQDAFDTKFKAFDKIAVVRGYQWARRTREWVVPVLQALVPLGVWEAAQFLEVKGPRLARYRRMIGKDDKLLASLAMQARIKGGVESLRAAFGSHPRTSVQHLLRIAKLLSDHAPCVVEYEVRLPRDYPVSGSPESVARPRPLGDNAKSVSSLDQGSAWQGKHGSGGDAPIVDGGAGKLTRAETAVTLTLPLTQNRSVGLTISRLACLRQERPSCGVRAAFNAYAIVSGQEALLQNHDVLVQTFGAPLPINIADTALRGGTPGVVDALRQLEVQDTVVFLGHFAELASIRDFVQSTAWTALNHVRLGTPDASVVIVTNTIGSDASLIQRRDGYGHYFVVHLRVVNSSIVARYVDSLVWEGEGQEDARAAARRDLIASLVKQLLSIT